MKNVMILSLFCVVSSASLADINCKISNGYTKKENSFVLSSTRPEFSHSFLVYTSAKGEERLDFTIKEGSALGNCSAKINYNFQFEIEGDIEVSTLASASTTVNCNKINLDFLYDQQTHTLKCY